MLLAEIEQLLRQSMGLDAASVGHPAIERAVRERTKAAGLCSVEEYLCCLNSSPSEVQELIESVIVPETWFFRDEEAFAGLARLGIDSLRHRPADMLRVLSVPCSTGEEPYSIVMALQDGGLSRRQMTVDAVDISLRVLAHARRGIFGRNSFRGQDLTFRERYFSPVAEGYAVADWMSQVITFRQGNLILGQYSFPAAPYDVIFCRNLLIYFDRSTQARVMQTLHALLAPDGILFVGSAEAFLAASSGFTSVSEVASVAFRSSKESLRPAGPTPHRRRIRIPEQSISLAPASAKLNQPSHAGGVSETTDNVPAARRLADLGRLPEAVQCCERIISRHGTSAEAYYLLGVLRDAAGECDSATECYRRAVYLEPDHVEALAHLALLSETQGDTAGAERLRARARRAAAAVEQKGGVTP